MTVAGPSAPRPPDAAGGAASAPDSAVTPADTSAAPRPATRYDLALAAIVVAALVLRIPGLFEGTRGGFGGGDEMMYVPKAIKYAGGDLNPHYFQNPPLASYLMLAAIGARYAWGRLTGDFASPLDFKAQFLAGAPDAFHAARSVSLALGLATVVLADRLARRLVPADADERVRRWTGLAAAVAVAASPLHVHRSAVATNETLVTFAFTAAALAAVRLAREATTRAALLAGALAGVSAASKYTGVVACVPAGLAALLAAERTTRERLRLCAVAAGASIAAFLVCCPWALLDFGTFRAHVTDLGTQKDRWDDDQGWLRYLETAWGPGLGPLWCVVAAGGIAVAAARVRRAASAHATVAAAAVVALAAVLLSHRQMANGRYLMPAYPAAIALGAVAVHACLGRRGSACLLALAIAGGVVQQRGVAGRYASARTPDTQAALAAWLRANLPDGAHVVGDSALPPLPDASARREFDGRLPPATAAAYTPAFRVTIAYRYFALPVNALAGTDVPVDDLAALRAHAPVWFVVSDDGLRNLENVAADDKPPLRWQRLVRESLPLVFEVPRSAERKGPALSVYVLR